LFKDNMDHVWKLSALSMKLTKIVKILPELNGINLLFFYLHYQRGILDAFYYEESWRFAGQSSMMKVKGKRGQSCFLEYST